MPFATLSLVEAESRVCDIAANQLGIRRDQVHPRLRLIQDLHCDSLDIVELFMSIEEAFEVTLPEDALDPVYKAVFTRDPFRLADLAELVYLRQCGGGPSRWGRLPAERQPHAPASQRVASFTQLGGRLEPGIADCALFERMESGRAYRRRTDGMVCIALPGGEVVIGSDNGAEDERPAHSTKLAPFLIDREPVSTTAFCRFLNSIGPVEQSVRETWFALPANDDRREHELITQVSVGQWAPRPGTDRMPMMLVSWYGASAYSLWANRRDWRRFDAPDEERGGYLPSEAQWEYAARGPLPRRFPWGDDDPTPDHARYGRHTRGQKYAPQELPLADVNVALGSSPFGLHHMAGNVWQWCRDWYDPSFYARPEASADNPVNRTPARVRSERGGSWIGCAALCRSSYRRGRVPSAKGRCLGFRCVSRWEAASD